MHMCHKCKCAACTYLVVSDVPLLESNKKTGQSTPQPMGEIESGVRELPSA